MKKRGLSGFLFFVIAAMFFIVAPSYALDGDLDSTFGTGGKVTTAIGSSNDSARALGIQSDNKIVVAGESYNGSNDDFALVRYNTDGSLDATFGTGGKVSTDFGNDDYASALGIQSDGKIVVAGSSFNGIEYDFALVRYNTGGTLDTGFGTGGKITTAIGSSDDSAWALGIQSDGKIVVAGYSDNVSYYDFAVVRYNTNGTLDSTFGINGIVTTAIGSENDEASAVAIQSDGKIVVAGSSFNGSEFDFAVVRYNTDGTLDATFGIDGIVTTAIGDYAWALGIQSDNKIVVAGESYNGSNDDFALVRYNTDGTLDTGFGTDGIVTTAIGSSNDYASALGIQSDGKIVVAGYSDNGGYVFAVVRYNTDGSLDTGFASDGKVITDIGSCDDYASTLGIQSDNKIVVAGLSSNCSNNDFALARYIVDTGIRNASGTYTWDSGTLTINTASSNFTCDGMLVGEEIITGVTITADTMTWPDGTTWIRSPSGAANDPVGIWTMSDIATGNSYTLTIVGNGTFSLAAVIIQCSSGGSVVSAYSEHWANGYYGQFWVDDPTHQYTSVTVTGPFISSLSLVYDMNCGCWNGWSGSYINFGLTHPATPLTYNFEIAGGTNQSDDIDNFVEPFATGLAPTGTVSVNPAFAWAEVSGGYTYGVELHDNSGATIWSVYDLTTPSIAYPGSPALTEGMTYNYTISVRDAYGNSSFAQASFTYQTALYVVWADDTYGNNEIFLKKSTDNGATWAFQRLTTNTGNSQFPVVAVSGTDVYVVWQDDTYGPSGVPEIFLKKSTDGGNTWTFQRLTTNTGNSQAPAIAVNGNEVYVVWQDDTYGPSGVPEIFLKKSTDGGNTWTFQRLTTNTGVSMNPSIAVNGNNVYAVWQDDTYGPAGVPEIFMKRSTDSGATWQFQRMTTNAGYSGRPSMVVDGGNIYVVWPDDTYGNYEIFFKKSIDGGNTWAFQRLTNNTGTSGRPSIALNSGNLYVVWEDNTYGNNEIFFKKSVDGGNTWTFQRLTTNTGASMNPSLRVNGTDVYTVWQDDTYGPAGVPEIFMKRSTDSGATWQFQRLTTNTGNSVMPAMAR